MLSELVSRELILTVGSSVTDEGSSRTEKESVNALDAYEKGEEAPSHSAISLSQVESSVWDSSPVSLSD